MAPRNILFIQGAGEGAHAEDRLTVEALERLLGTTIAYPRIEGLEEVDWDRAKMELTAALGEAEPDTLIIAHSLGGAAVLKVLADGNGLPDLGGLFLLGVPYKLVDGEFGKEGFAIDLDFASRLPSGLPITFYHSRDDEFVSFAHLARYESRLPLARFRAVDGYGHQFATKPVTELAEDMAPLLR